jgi:hypothetical protein
LQTRDSEAKPRGRHKYLLNGLLAPTLCHSNPTPFPRLLLPSLPSLANRPLLLHLSPKINILLSLTTIPNPIDNLCQMTAPVHPPARVVLPAPTTCYLPRHYTVTHLHPSSSFHSTIVTSNGTPTRHSSVAYNQPWWRWVPVRCHQVLRLAAQPVGHAKHIAAWRVPWPVQRFYASGLNCSVPFFMDCVFTTCWVFVVGLDPNLAKVTVWGLVPYATRWRQKE